MKYRDCNDGEWFWLAEDPTSFGKDFNVAKTDLLFDLETAISELEYVIGIVQDWKEGETSLQTKLVLPF